MIFGFIVLLSSLARVADLSKCLFLNDEPCMVRPTIIDMNPVKLKYYPSMISLNKCTGSCNFYLQKICVPKETKQWQNVFHVIVNAYSIVQRVIQIKNGIIRHFNVNVKIIICVKKIIVGYG